MVPLVALLVSHCCLNAAVAGSTVGLERIDDCGTTCSEVKLHPDHYKHTLCHLHPHAHHILSPVSSFSCWWCDRSLGFNTRAMIAPTYSTAWVKQCTIILTLTLVWLTHWRSHFCTLMHTKVEVCTRCYDSHWTHTSLTICSCVNRWPIIVCLWTV